MKKTHIVDTHPDGSFHDTTMCGRILENDMPAVSLDMWLDGKDAGESDLSLMRGHVSLVIRTCKTCQKEAK